MREILAASLVITLLSSAVLAETDTSDRDVLKGVEAFGGWQKDKPGVRRLLKPEDQPPVGKSTSNPGQIVKRSKHPKPIAPKGFSVDLIASGLAEPPVNRVAPTATCLLQIVKPTPFVFIVLPLAALTCQKRNLRKRLK